MSDDNLPNERATFERWILQTNGFMSLDDEFTGAAWQAWQARSALAAQATQPPAQPVAHICILPTKDAGPTKFFTSPSDPRGFPVYATSQPHREEPRDADKWRQAIDEALIVGCIGTAEPGDDPRRKLADLIEWKTKIALDPAVSSDAQALIERGRAEAGADAERYRWLRANAVREKELGDRYIEFHCDFANWKDVDAAIDTARSALESTNG